MTRDLRFSTFLPACLLPCDLVTQTANAIVQGANPWRSRAESAERWRRRERISRSRWMPLFLTAITLFGTLKHI
jgi:hypothetical protein